MFLPFTYIMQDKGVLTALEWFQFRMKAHVASRPRQSPQSHNMSFLKKTISP